MRRIVIASIALASCTALTAAARAQVPADSAHRTGPVVTEGQRVRVWSNLDLVSGFLARRGKVVSIDRDTLSVLEDDDSIPRRIAIAAITRIDVSRGVIPRRQGILRGAKYGAFVGVATSPLLAIRDRHNGDNVATVARTVIRDAFITGSIGTVIGAFLGTATHHTIWERVPLARAASIAPAPGGGYSATVRIAF